MSEQEDLVLAYRILAAHGVVDAYGHVSLRGGRVHPLRSRRSGALGRRDPGARHQGRRVSGREQ